MGLKGMQPSGMSNIGLDSTPASHFCGAGPGYMSMLEKMMRNPETRSLLYPYLPEPMRNPETFEWMLNNPEYRAQLEQVLSQQQVSSVAESQVLIVMCIQPQQLWRIPD